MLPAAVEVEEAVEEGEGVAVAAFSTFDSSP